MAGKPDADNPKSGADDKNGHGKATSGVIAAARNGSGAVGFAPSASIIAIQISKGSRLRTSDIIDGIELAVIRGADVVNMSFGGGFSQSEADAVIAASNAGLILVESAGNSSGGSVSYPAALPEVIAVTASTITDGLASFNSVGQEAEIITPGDDVFTTALDGGYRHVDGSSFSAPHVADVAALVLAAGVTDTNGNGRVNDEVRTILDSSAEDIELTANQQGNGLVDAENSVLGTTAGDNLPTNGEPPPALPPPGDTISAHVEDINPFSFDKGRPSNRGL